MPRPLTSKQLRVLQAIEDFLNENDGLAPTHNDLATVLDCSRATCSHHIGTLAEKGYIRRTRNWRDMEIINRRHQLAK
jgi:DNA-binding MarR family transcriptional regulator